MLEGGGEAGQVRDAGIAHVAAAHFQAAQLRELAARAQEEEGGARECRVHGSHSLVRMGASADGNLLGPNDPPPPQKKKHHHHPHLRAAQPASVMRAPNASRDSRFTSPETTFMASSAQGQERGSSAGIACMHAW